MKNKVFGIYAKVFSYTVLILVVVIVVAAAFFSNQISEIMQVMERQQLTSIFAPLLSGLEEKSNDEIIIFAEEFHQRNASVEFSIIAENGETLYYTPNTASLNLARAGDEMQNVFFGGMPVDNRFQTIELLPNGMIIYMASASSVGVVHSEFLQRTIIVLSVLFVIGALGASLFAYRITKPIKIIAHTTKRMTNLDLVPPPIPRRDEIGRLAEDVYKMYEALKTKLNG